MAAARVENAAEGATDIGQTETGHAFGILRGLAVVLFVVALPLLMVTSNIRVLLSDVGFYEWGLREHNAEARTGIPLAELDIAALEIQRYFENDESTLAITVIIDKEEQALFNSREIAHMEDVKDLVRALFLAHEAALVYVLAYIGGVFLWSRERGLRSLARQSLAGIGLAAAVVGAVGVFALTGFDSTWEKGHELVFTNDFWSLDPDTDRLIQMFPEPFWEDATLLVAALSVGEALLIGLVAGLFLALSHRPRIPGNLGEDS